MENIMMTEFLTTCAYCLGEVKTRKINGEWLTEPCLCEPMKLIQGHLANLSNMITAINTLKEVRK
jgi:hypothetical protein